MVDLPMIVSLTGRRIVVVGGGQTALRRARAMLTAGGDVCVIAPWTDPAFNDLPPHARFDRPYREGDLENAFLVVVATDDAETNAAVASEARRLNILVNRADRPELGDVIIPAYAQRGPLTVAVHTGGISARAAADIRDQLLQSLDPDIIRMLETVAPFREMFKQQIDDPRRRRRALRQLTDEAALKTLKTEGEVGLYAYCESVFKQALDEQRTE